MKADILSELIGKKYIEWKCERKGVKKYEFTWDIAARAAVAGAALEDKGVREFR